MADAEGNLLPDESGVRPGAPHDPSRTWVSRRVRLEDHENAWNVCHHNDPGNELSRNSCAGCPEEGVGGERRHPPHFPRHGSSCDEFPMPHRRLLHAYVDDDLYHLYLCGCVGHGRGRGAFVLCLSLVPFPDLYETGHANGCASRASHGYGWNVSCRRILVRDVYHGGLFP